ncbi:P-loop containing nucleoside triphosphate hydrolase protein, partial [Mycena albidolilacea]
LPPKPKIFHGRELELAAIVHLFTSRIARVAILGAGGMGKSSLAKAVVHHSHISSQFEQLLFVACDSVTNNIELAGVLAAHLGLKPNKDQTQQVIHHLSDGPTCLLVLDNLETSWEPTESRWKIEEFLSVLSELDHLGLLITMRGAERPMKVRWTRPFLPPLEPLSQEASRQTFVDIADMTHKPEQIDRILSFTDNMPLAITLLAHLVASEGCSYVISSWEHETTSVVSDGFHKTSNLALSISLSLSSPRISSLPQSQDLLSLLSILPDGLSAIELEQSKPPIADISKCKTALLRTSLAYLDEHKHLKSLVPIREYMRKIRPPGDHLVRPLLEHFQKLLQTHTKYFGNQYQSKGMADRISSNLSNIQNIISNGL